MKCFVTGATGRIGRALASELQRQGIGIRVLARDPERARDILGTDMEIVRGELEDSPALATFLAGASGDDALYHLATATSDAAGQRALHAVNVEGTRSVVQAALEAGIRRIVFASSIDVIGPLRREDVPGDEKTPCHPTRSYGVSKLRAEKVAHRLARKKRAELVVLRIGAVCDPKGESPLRAFLQDIRRHGALTRNLKVINECLFEPLSLTDLLPALVASSTTPGAGGTYILSGPEAVPMGEIFRQLSERSGLRLRESLWRRILGLGRRGEDSELLRYFRPAEEGRAHRSYSSRLAGEVLGFAPKVSPGELIEAAVLQEGTPVARVSSRHL